MKVEPFYFLLTCRSLPRVPTNLPSASLQSPEPLRRLLSCISIMLSMWMWLPSHEHLSASRLVLSRKQVLDIKACFFVEVVLDLCLCEPPELLQRRVEQDWLVRPDALVAVHDERAVEKNFPAVPFCSAFFRVVVRTPHVANGLFSEVEKSRNARSRLGHSPLGCHAEHLTRLERRLREIPLRLAVLPTKQEQALWVHEDGKGEEG